MACGWHDVLVPELRAMVHARLDAFTFRILAQVSWRDHAEVRATDRARVGPPTPALPPSLTGHEFKSIFIDSHYTTVDLAYLCGHERAAIELGLHLSANKWIIFGTDSAQSLRLRLASEKNASTYIDMPTVTWLLDHRRLACFAAVYDLNPRVCDEDVAQVIQCAIARGDLALVHRYCVALSNPLVPDLQYTMKLLYFFLGENIGPDVYECKTLTPAWRTFLDLLRWRSEFVPSCPPPFGNTTEPSYAPGPCTLDAQCVVDIYNKTGVLPSGAYLLDLVNSTAPEWTTIDRLRALTPAVICRLKYPQLAVDAILSGKYRVVEYLYNICAITLDHENYNMAINEGIEDVANFIKSVL